MSNNYFPGIGLFNLMNRNSNHSPEPEPEPEPESEEEQEYTLNVIYAELMGENREVTDLKKRLKLLKIKLEI